MQHTGETTALAAGGTNRGREAVTSSPKGGDDVTEATEEKPRPGPEGEKPAQHGQASDSRRGGLQAQRSGWLRGERKSQIAALLCGGGGSRKVNSLKTNKP